MGGAPQLIEETADADGVGQVVRTHLALERYRVLVAPEGPDAEGKGRVVLAITHEHKRSPQAPWTADRCANHPMSPHHARLLANMLTLAAARAERESPERPHGGRGDG